MTRKALANWVLIGTTVAGLSMFVVVTVRGGIHGHFVTLVLGILMVVISELYPLEMPQGSINLASAGFFSVLLVAGLPAAVWSLLLGSAFSYVRMPFRGLRSLSNVGNYILSLTVAWFTTRALHIAPSDLGAFIVVMVFTFTVVNHLLVNLYYYLLEGPSVIRGMGRAVAWDLLGWALTLPLAYIFFYLRRGIGQSGEILAVIPFGALAVSLGLWQQVNGQSRRLEAAAAASARIGASGSPDQVYQALSEALQEIVGYTALFIYLWDESRERLSARHVVHPEPDRLPPEAFSIRPGEGLLGAIVESREPELIPDLRQDDRVLPLPDDPAPTRSALVLPLVTEDDVLGVVTVSHADARRYRLQDLRLASILTAQAAVAIARSRLMAEKEALAVTDPMIPQLYNVRHFLTLLKDAVAHGDAHHPVSLAFLDLDRFKAINDTYGHLAGDEVLREVVQVVRRSIRSGDILARYAGDEFVLLLRDTTAEAAREVVDRVVGAVAGHRFEGVAVPLTFSVGVATYPDDADDVSTLLNVADARMYLQKSVRRPRSSRNRIS